MARERLNEDTFFGLCVCPMLFGLFWIIYLAENWWQYSIEKTICKEVLKKRNTPLTFLLCLYLVAFPILVLVFAFTGLLPASDASGPVELP